MSNEDWERVELSLGAGQFPPADREAAESVVALAEGILTGVSQGTRQQLLSEMDRFLNDFAPSIGRRRIPLRIGQRSCYQWVPSEGGALKSGQFDIEIFGCPEMLSYPPFIRFLRQISKDMERAFLKSLALIVLRDFGDGDYGSVLTARRSFDTWCTRLILRDEHTYEKRRKGGQRKGREQAERKARARARVLRMAERLRQANTPQADLVRTIDAELDRGSDAPYPSDRSIRRFLKDDGFLP